MGKSAILFKYGEKILKALVDTGYKIIVRPHPQSRISEKELLDRLQEAFPDNENFQWNYDNNNFEVLSKSDLMISDISGVIFDYTFIFDKPLIYANSEWDNAPYDAAWIDGPIWRYQAIEEIGYSLKEDDFDSLKEIIDNQLNSNLMKEKRSQKKDEAWQNRGNAAKATVDYLVQKREALR